VGPRAGLDDVEKRKFLTLYRLELRPLGRYTNYAIPAPQAQGTGYVMLLTISYRFISPPCTECKIM
jgi:hypothetical protein